jgi:cytoskeletal protein CcmA (bactofilin family)
MSRTTFSGPVKSDNGFEGNVTGNVTGDVTGTASAVSGAVTATSLVLPTSTSAALGAKANAINTTGKVANKAVYNTTTKTIYVAQGATDVSTWIDTADGSTTITPA